MIRAMREEKGLTQGELGKALHMTQRKISYLENDRFEPNLQDLRDLCRFFQVSADSLLGLSASPEINKKKTS